MKVTLSFNLPEDQEQYENCILGSNFKAAMQDFDNKLRSKIKYTNDHNLERARKLFLQTLKDRNITLW